MVLDLIKISFLLMCAGNVLSSTSENSKPWQYNARKANTSPDETQHCFCYPDGDLPVVHKLLDSKNNGQERLVVYLYKSVDSDEIKMYTPSAEKQVLIPDLPYDSNDGLVTLTNDNISTLFYKNPYKIKVYNDRLETLNPTVVSSSPIGLNQGEIEHILPGDNSDAGLKDNDSSNGYDYNGDDLPEYNGYSANLPQPEAPQALPLNFDSSFLQNYLEPNQISVHPNINSEGFENTPTTLNLNNLQDSLPESQAFPLLPDDELKPQLVYSFQNVANVATSPEASFDAWFKQQMKRFQNAHFPGDLKTIDSDLLKLFVIKIFSENKIYISNNGVLTGPNGEIIDTANLELRPLLLGEKISLQFFNNSRKKINLLKRLPFLEGILVTLVSPPRILGIIPLGKIYLTKTANYLDQILGRLSALNSSKVYTNKHTDATIYVNPSSLTLNDILSKAEKLNEKNNGKMETDIQVQAVPLPDKETLRRSGLFWNSGQYYTAPNVPYPNWNPLVEIEPLAKRRKLSNVKIEHLYEPPIRTSKKENSTQKGLQDEKIEVTSTIKLQNSTEASRRFSKPLLKGMLKTLMFLLNDAPSRREYQSHSNSTENFDIISDAELTKYDEDGPDFRIIGGSAATGSGTPVSNKGRSGFKENFSS